MKKAFHMFRKIFGYFKYRKIIEDNLDILTNRYKLRYDKIYGRLYTIISIPERRQEVLKNYKMPAKLQNPIDTDVKSYLDVEVRNYISSIEEYFYSIGLFELVSISRIDNVDDVNILLVLRYKFKNHQNFLYMIFGLIGFVIGTALITGFVKLILILINFIITL